MPPSRLPLVAVLLLALALPLAAGAAPPRQYAATVTHVSDGDTLWVRPPGGGPPLPVRVQGIDAPERCQAWGPQARDALAQRVLHRRVLVRERGRDGYDRVLARVHADGQDVGRWLVAGGHAWSDRFRGRPGPYDREQAEARQARRGLWSAAAPVPPRQFRREHGPCPRPGD